MFVFFVGILWSEGCAMTERQYDRLVKDMAPKSPIGKDCFNAFWK